MTRIEIELPYQIDFTWYRTVDQRFIYIMQDAEGVAVDNSNYHIQMQVRKEPGSTVLVDRSTDNGGVILGGANGQITIVTPHTLLTSIPEATYQHDVIEEPPGGDRTMIFRGKIAIKPGITETTP